MSRSRPQQRYVPNGVNKQRQAPAKKQKPYKVILEDVTQEKRSLPYKVGQTPPWVPRQADEVFKVTYDEDAPEGYVYVPFGSGLSQYCKELCKERGLLVYEVHTRGYGPGPENTDHVAHHLLRTGFHFPNEIVEQAVKMHNDKIGPSKRNGRRNRKEARRSGPLSKAVNSHGQQLSSNGEDVPARLQKQQIRDAVKEIFPRIPPGDLDRIVLRASKEGTVGAAADLTPARRVQLAVGAHIRHQHTHYDQLLKVTSYLQARQTIAEEVKQKIIEWRGEQKEGTGMVELEESFREVIYIDDDDDVEDTEVVESTEEAEPLESEDENEEDDEEYSPPPAEHVQLPPHPIIRKSSVEFLMERPKTRIQPQRSVWPPPSLPGAPASALLPPSQYVQPPLQPSLQPLQQNHMPPKLGDNRFYGANEPYRPEAPFPPPQMYQRPYLRPAQPTGMQQRPQPFLENVPPPRRHAGEIIYESIEGPHLRESTVRKRQSNGVTMGDQSQFAPHVLGPQLYR